jgi:hypothetical protein
MVSIKVKFFHLAQRGNLLKDLFDIKIIFSFTAIESHVTLEELLRTCDVRKYALVNLDIRNITS